MSYNCPNCRQSLRPVTQIEVKRAVQLLTALAKDSTNYNLPYPTTGDGRAWKAVAALALSSHRENYSLAAQVLSDGWLPPGYILVKGIPECQCPWTLDDVRTSAITGKHSNYYCVLGEWLLD